MKKIEAMQMVNELISKYENAKTVQEKVAEKAEKKYKRLLEKYGFDWCIDELSDAKKMYDIEDGILYDLSIGLNAVKRLLERRLDEHDVIGMENLSYWQDKLQTVREDNVRLFNSNM